MCWRFFQLSSAILVQVSCTSWFRMSVSASRLFAVSKPLDHPSSVSLSNNTVATKFEWPAAELFFRLAFTRADGDRRLGLGAHLGFNLGRQFCMFAQECFRILTSLSQALFLVQVVGTALGDDF